MTIFQYLFMVTMGKKNYYMMRVCMKKKITKKILLLISTLSSVKSKSSCALNGNDMDFIDWLNPLGISPFLSPSVWRVAEALRAPAPVCGVTRATGG